MMWVGGRHSCSLVRDILLSGTRQLAPRLSACMIYRGFLQHLTFIFVVNSLQGEFRIILKISRYD